jgi:acyl-CoA reductase-like NAD-dependent aldehyde dehydrogenase
MSYHLDVDALKKAKLHISLPLLIALMLVVWKGDDGIIYWLDASFVSEVEAAELSEAVKGAVETANATSQQLITYIRREEIQAARAELRSLEDSMQETLLWESQNGENTISEARKDDIDERIDETEILIECLDDGRDDCNA